MGPQIPNITAQRVPKSTPETQNRLPKPKINPQRQKQTTPRGRKIDSQRPRTDSHRLKSNSEMPKIAAQMLKIESQKPKFDFKRPKIDSQWPSLDSLLGFILDKHSNKRHKKLTQIPLLIHRFSWVNSLIKLSRQIICKILKRPKLTPRGLKSTTRCPSSTSWGLTWFPKPEIDSYTPKIDPQRLKIDL